MRIHSDECRHLGNDKVYKMLSQWVFWYHMSEEVTGLLAVYKTCQWAKAGQGSGRPPLDWDLERILMARLCMDIVRPFKERGNACKYILVVQDYFSKYFEIFPLCEYCAATVTDILVWEIFTRNGICQRIHSDQGLECDAMVDKGGMYVLGDVQKTRTLPFAPLSNGMVERSKGMINLILKTVTDHLNDWER